MTKFVVDVDELMNGEEVNEFGFIKNLRKFCFVIFKIFLLGLRKF